MNISEAQKKQKELQDNIEVLQEKLLANAFVVKGDKPKEDPNAIYHQIWMLFKQLNKLYSKISEAISKVYIGDKLFIEIIGDGKIHDYRIQLIEQCLEKAKEATDNDEVVIDTDILAKQLDTLREIKHDTDVKIIAAMENTKIS
jgi:hypothetical protein